MAPDRAAALFFELFDGLPRQGPGSAASTLRALGLVPDVGPDTRILDIGCGTGAQTWVLAQASASRIVAVDLHEPYVEALNGKARGLGVAHRVEARVADMRCLDFADASFDLIWCEGAVYNAGFEAGLGDWRRLLPPGGHVALTELCWQRIGRPSECAAFWNREYPAIRHVAALLGAAEACGYEIVGHFPLPASAWWDDYYRPLQANAVAFRERHRDAKDAVALADRVLREIGIWRAYAAFYGYEFLVLRTEDGR